jgi:two-component system chemotaxis response regulator CheY
MMNVFPGNTHDDSRMIFKSSSGSDGFLTLSPSTILVVDDDPDIRSLTRTFLEHEGYAVYSSGDAERAAQIFKSAPQIDLLVTDLYMPHWSGMELAFELKALRSELPVLLISGGMVDEVQKGRLQEEGWSFLAKPFRLPELLATVHRVLAPVEARRCREARQGCAVDGLLPRCSE